jgi:intron-binding protein aquarius
VKAHLANPHGADINKYLKAGAPKPEFKRARGAEPTVDQIQSDNLTALAKTYWAPQTKKNHVDFNADVVAEIYRNDIKGSGFSIKRIMMLEFSQYLENFLWPNFSGGEEGGKGPSLEHVMSIVVIVNEKFRERVPAWAAFQYRPDQFPALFQVRQRLTVLLHQRSVS